MLRSQDFNIPAGAAITVSMRLSYLRCMVLNGGLGAYLLVQLPAGGGDVPLLPGQGFDLVETVDGVILKNPQATAISGSVVLGDGRFHDGRVTGNVTVVDQSTDKTAAGQQFMGSYARTAGAGAFAIVGFRANAKTVSIYRLMFGCTSSCLATVFTCTGDPTTSPVVSTGIGRNLIAGVGAASSCRGITGEAAAAGPTAGELPGVGQFATLLLSASVLLDISLDTPIRLNPGQGLVLVPNVAAVTAFAVAQFEEL